jgi:hypothetical protein
MRPSSFFFSMCLIAYAFSISPATQTNQLKHRDVLAAMVFSAFCANGTGFPAASSGNMPRGILQRPFSLSILPAICPNLFFYFLRNL